MNCVNLSLKYDQLSQVSPFSTQHPDIGVSLISVSQQNNPFYVYETLVAKILERAIMPSDELHCIKGALYLLVEGSY